MIVFRLRIYDVVSLYLSHDLMANDTQFSVDATGLCQVMRPYKAKVIFYLFFVLRYGESSSDFNNSKNLEREQKNTTEDVQMAAMKPQK